MVFIFRVSLPLQVIFTFDVTSSFTCYYLRGFKFSLFYTKISCTVVVVVVPLVDVYDWHNSENIAHSIPLDPQAGRLQ
jgi:hypothetical protein